MKYELHDIDPKPIQNLIYRFEEHEQQPRVHH